MQVQQVQQYQHKPVWSLVHCWVLQHKIFAYNIGTHSLVLCQHLRSHLFFISHIKAWPPLTCCSIVLLVRTHLLFFSYIKNPGGLDLVSSCLPIRGGASAVGVQPRGESKLLWNKEQVLSLCGYECEFWGRFYHLKHPNRTLLLVFVKFSSPFRYTELHTTLPSQLENIAQIYPLWFRTSGVSISTGFNWSLNLIVTFTFPYLQQVAF